MDKKMMVIRFFSVRKVDFISEHKVLIEKNGSVWMLKSGKKIPDSSLKNVLESGGVILLKAPKIEGGRFYKAHFVDFFLGVPKPEMIFPDYYSSLENEYDYEKSILDGTWFKVDSILEMQDSDVDELVLWSNGKKLKDVINQTRTSVMYVKEA